MRVNRTVLALVVMALSAVSIGAQAMGIDIAGFINQHQDIFAGLSMMAFAGEISTLDTVKKALDKVTDEVREVAERALSEAKSGVNLGTKAKEQADELLIKMNQLTADLKEAEQKMVSAGGYGSGVPQKTTGQQVVESEKYKSLMKNGGRGSFSVETKVVTSVSAGPGLIRPLDETAIVGIPMRRLTVRDLLPVIPISTSSVDYPKQTARTNNAAMVAEGMAKPYSDYTWGNATAPVRTVAHLAKLTRQAMDDAPRLVGEVDAEMRYGLALVEEAQLLYGNGVDQNLNGIVPQATAYVAPFALAGATSLDNVRLAMLQATLAMYPADGVVLSLWDWTRIELSKTTEGAYLFANPQGTVQPTLWGLPVVASPAMEIDKFLVGAFRFGATIYDRMAVEVLISTENADDFEKNLATMRCEERIALAVKRPQSFVYGDFGIVV